MVFTANAPLSQFVSGFSPINRDPVQRRLKEFFHPVKFAVGQGS